MIEPTLKALKEVLDAKGFPKLVDFIKYSSGLILAGIVIWKLFACLDVVPEKLDMLISNSSAIINKLDQCISQKVAYKK